ncbi:MAG: glycosyltransferase family 1 protein [candidate division WOR-3 bacterium]
MSGRIRIALDARRAVRRMTGIGRYVLHLARYLPGLGPEFRFDLLVDRPLPSDMLPEGCRQVVLGRYVGDGTPAARFYSPFWLNICVPRYLAQEGVALFHGTNFVIPLRTECKVVATLHDLAFIRIPHAYGPLYKRYMKMQVKMSLNRADAVITGSVAAKKDLIDILKADPSRITVIYHGVGEEFKERGAHDERYLKDVRSRLELPHRYILYVGVIEAKKNIPSLLRGGGEVIRSGLSDAVVLAGRDGLGAGAIRRFTKEIGLAERVRFLGYVPQELLPGLYALAQVVVFPSLYEGFGMPVLESMASGVPAIVSGFSSLPEVGGDAAIVLKVADGEEIAEALRRLLSDNALYEELRSRGLARAKQFSWKESAAKHIAVYRRVLG